MRGEKIKLLTYQEVLENIKKIYYIFILRDIILSKLISEEVRVKV